MRAYYWFSLSALLVCGLVWALVMIGHIAYPGFVGTMEGDSLQHIERLADGQPIYVRPQGDFIPLCYMPFYYVASLPFYSMFGDSFAGPRLLSALAALLSALLVGQIAWRQSGSRPTAWLAMALYFASYRLMDAYTSSALPDSLFLFWVLLGAYFLAYGKSRLHDAAFVGAFCISFWTRQIGSLYAVPALTYAVFFRKNYLPRWMLLVLFVVGGPVAYFFLGPLFGDRFFFYTLTLPGQWDHQAIFAVRRTAFVVACFVPAATLLTAIALARPGKWMVPVRPVVWLIGTTFVVSNVTMMSAGSSNNHYIPFIAALCITSALGAHSLITHGVPRRLITWIGLTGAIAALIAVVSYLKFPDRDLPVLAPGVMFLALGLLVVLRRSVAETRFPLVAGLVLLGAQFAAAAYNPANYLPCAHYQEQLDDLRTELAGLDAPVIWLPYGNAPRALTGKKLARGPSWVVLDDIARQVGARSPSDTDLSAFHRAITETPALYLLSDTHLRWIAGWDRHEAEFELNREYKDRFSRIQQATHQWYAGRSYPRFLYRKRTIPGNP